MRPETLISYLRAQPFRPFRLVMNSGHTFEVRHPEIIRVGRDVLHYYYVDSPDGPFERWDTISLLLIEKLERLEAPATSGGNGSV